MEFRRDINGLRAYAVMAVVFYHFGLAGVTSGFAGVDVFFVISGFLMTGLILGRLRQSRFSLMDFYLGRCRRIIPALAVLSAALMLFGYFWLIPSDYKTLGEHVASAITFVSNFVFKGEEGYFDAPMRDKWMLHTWSLSVEWQFYLLYPLFLIWLNRIFRLGNKKLILILFALGLASLTASAIFAVSKASFCFYLLPTRIWEFMAGAIVYILSQESQSSFRRNRAVEFFGFVLMAGSFFIFNDDTPWPGYAAAMTVFGTAMIILAADESSVLTKNALIQFLGKTSYSIYLWHWPVFVGLGYFGAAGWKWSVAGIVFSLILGALSYFMIETPSQQKMVRWPQKSALSFFLMLVALLACTGITVYAADGLAYRVSPQIRSIDSATESRYKIDKNCGFNNSAQTLTRCYIGDGNGIGFAVWGDSHAGVIAGPVAEAAKTRGLIYSQGCPTIFNVRVGTKSKERCKEFNDLVFEDIKTLPKDVPVIILDRFSYYILGFNEGIKKQPRLTYLDMPEAEVKKDPQGAFKKKLTESLCTIAMDRKLYVVQPIAEMGQDVPKTMARRLMVGRSMPEISVSAEDYARRHQIVLQALDAARDQCGVQLLDPLPYLCKDGKCPGAINGAPVYFDDDHLNERGSRLLIPMFEKIFQ